jgi:hypothetical protein
MAKAHKRYLGKPRSKKSKLKHLKIIKTNNEILSNLKK